MDGLNIALVKHRSNLWGAPDRLCHGVVPDRFRLYQLQLVWRVLRLVVTRLQFNQKGVSLGTSTVLDGMR